jgi:hypothetical protein
MVGGADDGEKLVISQASGRSQLAYHAKGVSIDFNAIIILATSLSRMLTRPLGVARQWQSAGDRVSWQPSSSLV